MSAGLIPSRESIKEKMLEAESGMGMEEGFGFIDWEIKEVSINGILYLARFGIFNNVDHEPCQRCGKTADATLLYLDEVWDSHGNVVENVTIVNMICEQFETRLDELVCEEMCVGPEVEMAEKMEALGDLEREILRGEHDDDNPEISLLA